jgi:hypothetical protein
MNGYRDRVRRHQEALAASRVQGEQAAVPRLEWVAVVMESVGDAVEALVPHGRGGKGPQRSAKDADRPAD